MSVSKIKKVLTKLFIHKPRKSHLDRYLESKCILNNSDLEYHLRQYQQRGYIRPWQID